jgi:hypothetical protein
MLDLVNQNIVSWNPMKMWLAQLAALRLAAYAAMPSERRAP